MKNKHDVQVKTEYEKGINIKHLSTKFLKYGAYKSQIEEKQIR